jgi:glutathione S-transferase
MIHLYPRQEMSHARETLPGQFQPAVKRAPHLLSSGRSDALSSALKLYQAAGSPNSRRVRVFLAEKGLTASLVPIDLGRGEQDSHAYRAINPRGLVPTLVLNDGTAIGEVSAIWRYFEDCSPLAPSLLGVTPKDKALITMWERRVELEGLAAVIEGVRNAAPSLKGRAIARPHGYEQIPALVERSRARIRDFFADLDTRLAQARFVAGDTFSAADITMVVTVDFAAHAFDMPLPRNAHALKRWYDTVSARASMEA